MYYSLTNSAVTGVDFIPQKGNILLIQTHSSKRIGADMPRSHKASEPAYEDGMIPDPFLLNKNYEFRKKSKSKCKNIHR